MPLMYILMKFYMPMWNRLLIIAYISISEANIRLVASLFLHST